MTASKASSQNGKKKGQDKAKEADPLRVVTYRLRQAHKDKVALYALELGRLQNPPRQISSNEAMQHMIMHAKVPKEKSSEAPSAGAGG